jgi:hypothetical protein
MSFLQKLFCFLFLFSCGLAGEGLVYAQKATIKSIYVRPITLETQLSQQEFNGVAKFEAQPAQMGKIYWTITDEYGALQWSEILDWDDTFATQAENWELSQIKIPFAYDFAEKNKQGVFNVRFYVHNKKGQLMAQGHKRIEVRVIDRQTRISNLKLQKNDEAIGVSFLVFQENVGNVESMSFTPHIRIYEYKSGGRLFSEFQGEQQTVVGREKKQIELVVDVPTKPKRYVLDVEIVDDRGQSLAGILSEKFLVPGDFAHTEFVIFSAESVMKTGDELTIDVGGFVRNTQDPLLVQATVQQFYNETKVTSHTLQETIADFSFDEFSTSFVVTVEDPGATHWKAAVRLLQNTLVLEESGFESIVFETQKPLAPEMSEEHSNLWFWILGIGICILLIFVFGGSARKKNFLFFFLSLCLIPNVWAQLGTGEGGSEPLTVIDPPKILETEPTIGSESDADFLATFPAPGEDINPKASDDFIGFRYLFFKGQLVDQETPPNNGLLLSDTQVSLLLRSQTSGDLYISEPVTIANAHYDIIHDGQYSLTITNAWKDFQFLMLTGTSENDNISTPDSILLKEYTLDEETPLRYENVSGPEILWDNLDEGTYDWSFLFYNTALGVGPNFVGWNPDDLYIDIDMVAPEIEIEFDHPTQEPHYNSAQHEPWFGRLTDAIDLVDIFFPNNPDKTNIERQADFDTPDDTVPPDTSEYGHFFVNDSEGPLTRVGCRDKVFESDTVYRPCFNPDYNQSDPNSIALESWYFDPYRTKGNFCFDDDLDSETDAYCYDDIPDPKIRGFRVCDMVGNCTDYSQEKNEIFINFYDPRNPKTQSPEFELQQVLQGQTQEYPYQSSNERGEASETYQLSLGIVDPTEFSDSLDDTPCEPTRTNQFRPYPNSNSEYCTTRTVPCRRFTQSGGVEIVPVAPGETCQDSFGGGGGSTDCCHWQFPYCFPIYFGTPPVHCQTTPTIISACMIIDTPGDYELDGDIGSAIVDDTCCIRITANDVSLDGSGYVMENSDPNNGRAVCVSGDRVSVSNMDIENYRTGIVFNPVMMTEGWILNNTLSTTSESISLENNTVAVQILNNTLLGSLDISSSLGGNIIRDNRFMNPVLFPYVFNNDPSNLFEMNYYGNIGTTGISDTDSDGFGDTDVYDENTSVGGWIGSGEDILPRMNP